MTQFADIPGCDELFTEENTHGGDIASILDEDAADITDFQGEVSVQLVAFLRTLSDPRVLDPEAMAPWVAPESALEVTETSSEWAEYCEVMTDREAELNLRSKGFRWVVTGEIVDGLNVNAGVQFYDLFGLGYWGLVDPDFTAGSGLPRSTATLAVLALEAMDATQRAALVAGYQALLHDDTHLRILQLRQEVYTLMQQRRDGLAVSDAALAERLTELAELEGAAMFTVARAYRSAMAALEEPDRAAHLALLRRLENGDLDELSEEVYDRETRTVQLSAAVRSELSALDTAGGPPWEAYVAGYLSWWTGWECRGAFMPRPDSGGRRANYFGFLPWSQRYLFDLQTGTTGPGALLLEISNVVRTEERALGLEAEFEDALATSVLAQRAQLEGRATLAELLYALRDLDRPEGAVAALEQPIVDATTAIAVHEAEQLSAELAYYVPLAQALESSGRTRLREYLACIEDPATQAMRNNGGFDALGGGSCVP